MLRLKKGSGCWAHKAKGYETATYQHSYTATQLHSHDVASRTIRPAGLKGPSFPRCRDTMTRAESSNDSGEEDRSDVSQGELDLPCPDVQQLAVKSYYQALNRDIDEIRLIQILPGSGDTDIRCEVTAYALAQAPNYLALSYTWGRPDPNCVIRINGERCLIRKNLYRFLQHVKNLPQYVNQPLWIDAVCVDQNDNKERTHQVGLMSTLYTRAWKVVVWLGPAYGQSEEAMAAIKQYGPHYSPRKMSKIWWSSAGTGIRNLCERGYWTRLWVVQELVLSRNTTILCGAREISWAQFDHFLTTCRLHPPQSRREKCSPYQLTMEGRAASMVKQIAQARDNASLVEQMDASKHLSCFDHRDRVYALLGIVKRGHGSISPDYTIPLSILLNAVLKQDPVFRKLNSIAEVESRCQWFAKVAQVDIEDIYSLKSTKFQARDTFPLESQGISLWWAASHEHAEVVEMWMKAHERSELAQIFVSAASSGEMAACALLLRCGFSDVDLVGSEGRRALAHVAETGDIPFVKLLLRMESNSMAVASESVDQNQTPLQLAVHSGHETIARILLHHSSKSGRMDQLIRLRNMLRHALLAAAEQAHGDGVMLASRLLRDLPSVVERPHEDSTLRHTPGVGEIDRSIKALRDAIRRNDMSITEMLLREQWIDVMAKHSEEYVYTSPLSSLGADATPSLVSLLLQHDRMDVSRGYPLRDAIINRSKAAVGLLVNLPDLDVNAPSWWDLRTPLIQAAAQGSVEIMKSLLGRMDLNLDAVDRDKCSSLTRAIMSSNIGAVRLLLNDPRLLGIDQYERDQLREWCERGLIDITEIPFAIYQLKLDAQVAGRKLLKRIDHGCTLR